MKKKIVNQGYTIIKKDRVGKIMVVVGHHPKAPQPYVTWRAKADSASPSYEIGHYFSTLQDAMMDYYKRLAEAWEYYPPIQTKPQKSRKDEPPAR